MPATLANVTETGMRKLKERLHPAMDRRMLIFAAGALNNRNLKGTLGSQELSTFYDGMVAGGHIDENPYWPEQARK